MSVIANKGHTLLTGIRIQSLSEDYNLAAMGFWDEALMEMFNYLNLVSNDEKKEQFNPNHWGGLQRALKALKNED